jgi:hypothetical protein
LTVRLDDYTREVVASKEGLPGEVAQLSAAFPVGISILSKLGRFHDEGSSETLWALAPTREEKKGMKYPVLDSDQMIPFLQSVLAGFSIGYTRASVSIDVAPDGRTVVQKIYYFVWCKETSEGMTFRQDWVSDSSHNDQAGGLTRAHRRFLKGLTGFIERDEDKLEQHKANSTGPYQQKSQTGPYQRPQQQAQASPASSGQTSQQHQGPYSANGANATQQQATPGQSTTGASVYEQNQHALAQLPPDEQIRRMADEAFGRDPEDLSAGPPASSEISKDFQAEAMSRFLVLNGFDKGVAAQLVMADWAGALRENGYPEEIVSALVGASNEDPLMSIGLVKASLQGGANLADAVRDILLGAAQGSSSQVEAIFAGTGFDMSLGQPPLVIQALWACLNSPLTTPSFP